MVNPNSIEKPRKRGRPPKYKFINPETMDTSGYTLDDKKTNLIKKEDETIISEKIELGTISQNEIKKDDTKKFEIIEKIEFKNGENILSIRFSKKNNRMFRIQVFLNDEFEIRPVTYSGSSTGISFWNLLKGSLKK